MEYFARTCKCGNIVKYSRGDNGEMKCLEMTGFFRRIVAGLKRGWRRNARRRISDAKLYQVKYAQATPFVSPSDRILCMYCLKCKARLYLHKFQKMDI